MKDGFLMLGCILIMASVFMLDVSLDATTLVYIAIAAIASGFLLTGAVLSFWESVKTESL